MRHKNTTLKSAFALAIAILSNSQDSKAILNATGEPIQQTQGRGSGKLRLIAQAPDAGRRAQPRLLQPRQRKSVEFSRPNLQQITLFDREGKVLAVLGEPGLYSQPALSPDGRRVAVIKAGPGAGERQVWVFNTRTRRGMQITAGGSARSSPVWSPDGQQIAYIADSSVYRKRADGSGSELLVYRHTPGAEVFLTDWSPSGRLCLWSGDSLFVVPFRRDLKVQEWPKARGGRFSPDGRYIAYNSEASGQWGIYVAPLDGSAPATLVSVAPSAGGISWRLDGNELYYLSEAPEHSLMIVEIAGSPELETGSPQALFPLPIDAVPSAQLQFGNTASASGRRFVFLTSARPASGPQ